MSASSFQVSATSLTASSDPADSFPVSQEGDTSQAASPKAVDGSRRTRRWRIALVVFALLWGIDLLQPPRRQLTTWVLLTTIGTYQATLSPLMPSLGVHCRFTPTCSHYGEAVIREYGAVKGVGLTLWRVVRCGPWTEAGTEDPP